MRVRWTSSPRINLLLSHFNCQMGVQKLIKEIFPGSSLFL
jgi:hypothetical protein